MADIPDEDAFAAAMRRMAQPLPDDEPANAEYAAAEALKLSGALAPGPANDDEALVADAED